MWRCSANSQVLAETISAPQELRIAAQESVSTAWKARLDARRVTDCNYSRPPITAPAVLLLSDVLSRASAALTADRRRRNTGCETDHKQEVDQREITEQLPGDPWVEQARMPCPRHSRSPH